jgi:hypothetical protein
VELIQIVEPIVHYCGYYKSDANGTIGKYAGICHALIKEVKATCHEETAILHEHVQLKRVANEPTPHGLSTFHWNMSHPTSARNDSQKA